MNLTQWSFTVSAESAAMRKYFKLFATAIADTTAYRARMLIWALVDASYIFVFPFLWLAIYGSREEVAGFDRQEIVTYYLVLLLMSATVNTYLDYVTIEKIRDGEASKYLTKPINFFFYEYIVGFPYNAVKLFFILLFFFIASPWLKQYFVFPSSVLHLLSIALVFAAANIMRSVWEFIVGMSAFWLEEAGSVRNVNHAAILLFAGELAPLAFFPLWFQETSAYLPFRYFVSFPIDVYLQRVDGFGILTGVVGMLAWTAVFAIIAMVVWRRGVRRYTAVGDA